MSQKLNLLECSFDQLRIVAPMWSKGTLKEAMGVIQATLKHYQKRAKEEQLFKISGAALTYEQVERDLIRKASILQHEYHRRMRVAGVLKSDLHEKSKRIVENTNERFMKLK